MKPQVLSGKKKKYIGGHIPIVAMTAHAVKGDRERCLQAGMDDYVSKPLQPGQLVDTIDKVIKESRHIHPQQRPKKNSSCQARISRFYSYLKAAAGSERAALKA